jgi:hypothetical protein
MATRLRSEHMERSKPPSRTPAKLSSPLHELASTYALAAGAAGVSLLALATPLEAEVVYTPANATVGRDGTYSLDVNNDGIVDYMLAEHANKDGSFGTFQVLSVRAAIANQVACPSTFCISGDSYAIALRKGSTIGSKQHPRGWGHGGPMASEELIKGGGVYYGHETFGWSNVTDRYLGLRFKINGEYHYGWARLTVKFHPGPPAVRSWEAHLTGYAYETIANKSILAGQTSGSNDAGDDPSSSAISRNPEPQFAALGTLALGANGIAVRRGN